MSQLESVPIPHDAFRVSNEELYALVSALSDQVAALQASHEKILAKVTQYGDDIKPTIEALAKSPLGRFLGVK